MAWRRRCSATRTSWTRCPRCPPRPVSSRVYAADVVVAPYAGCSASQGRTDHGLIRCTLSLQKMHGALSSGHSGHGVHVVRSVNPELRCSILSSIGSSRCSVAFPILSSCCICSGDINVYTHLRRRRHVWNGVRTGQRVPKTQTPIYIFSIETIQ